MTLRLTAVSVAAAAAGVVVLLVARRRTGRVTTGAVLLAVFVSGCAVAAASAVGVASGLGVFGLAHLWYLAVVVAVPILGLAVLGVGRLRSRGRARTSRSAAALGVLLLVPGPLGVYATHIAPYRLEVDQVTVPLDAARAGERRVRVAVLADLQTAGVGAHERAAVREVLHSEPDVILIPGDLFQGSFETLLREAPELRRLLSSLRAPGGVYFVEGDVDRGDRIEALLSETGIRILDDEVVAIRVGDRRLLIGGTRKDYRSAAAARVRWELVEAAGDEAITILMSHRPDTVLALPPASGLDLTVAGHTHGGQISLPLIGPLVTLSEVPRAVGAGGLHTVDGNRIYVSTGVGMERGDAPQVRFGVRPSVAVLDLVSG